MVRIAFDKERVLASHFLLQHLKPEELKRFAATATLANHQAQSVIFQKGDPGSSMMAVIRGRVKICARSVDGKELVINILRKDDLFGEIALLDGEPRTADAVALEETDLLVLERSKFIPILMDNPDIALRLLSFMCQRLRITNEHLEDALFLEAPARLARCLLRLVPSHGKPAQSGVLLDVKLSQQQLAGLVGLSRERVNKQLKEWERDGLLSFEKGFVTLHDQHELEQLASAGA